MKQLQEKTMLSVWNKLESTEGRIGYLIAWLLGVPVSLLFIVFLIRGH